MPLHPRTRKVVDEHQIKVNALDIIEPVGYFDMLYLLKHCGIVITDSGGLQKKRTSLINHVLQSSIILHGRIGTSWCQYYC